MADRQKKGHDSQLTDHLTRARLNENEYIFYHDIIIKQLEISIDSSLSQSGSEKKYIYSGYTIYDINNIYHMYICE